ncbi:MAG: cytochrome c [Bdellovibrionaceae bacterium]|nr:cytochrome c [Pseudobdellovibrionaceae bacterium]
MKCHKGNGFLARGYLTRQNMPTIKFMLERGYMPPFGLSMTDEEQQQIQQFLRGF